MIRKDTIEKARDAYVDAHGYDRSTVHLDLEGLLAESGRGAAAARAWWDQRGVSGEDVQAWCAEAAVDGPGMLIALLDKVSSDSARPLLVQALFASVLEQGIGTGFQLAGEAAKRLAQEVADLREELREEKDDGAAESAEGLHTAMEIIDAPHDAKEEA